MPHQQEFRNRAHEVSRLEAFSDVIFGFAISLLVVSLEAPKSYEELMEMMHGMLPFALCFFIFIDMWFEHHHFFRRYALTDTPTIAINTVLLFVILFYVYPMRYMLTLAARAFLGEAANMPFDHARTLFTIYGLGFAAVFGLLAALYYRAWLLREKLELNAVERIDTLESIIDNVATGSIGLLSALLAQTPLIVLAGMIYFVIGVPKTLVPMIMRRKRAAVGRAMEAEAAA
ncbi:MAG TPA: TMEM175 family protein [Thermoanaerobaculia bacterium]|nr:TMEM175 family protein [Thermoanaerobaculia bacterium]